MERHTDTVYVEAPARLHFGVLDLRGSFGRWFGGVGAAAPDPTVLVSARRSNALVVEGTEQERAESIARRFLSHHRLSGGVRLSVERMIPAHVGLGSGTQLALAIGRAIAELHGLDVHPAAIAHAVGRAERSAIGTWTFAGGGLVVEGGRRRADAEAPDRSVAAGISPPQVAPLIARIPFPPDWWCVVGVPHGAPGLSGESEVRAFRDLPAPDQGEVDAVSHLVLMGLLPALVDADLEVFGEALSEVQAITGRWFAPVQGGAFASGPSEALVGAMKNWGVRGVGQSSWGPAVYGIAPSGEAGRELAARVRDWIGTDGTVYDGPFRAEGARVWREPASRSAGLKIRA